MEIEAWLKEQRVSAEAYDVCALLSNFIDEMEQGLCGDSSSLAMIPAYVGASGKIPVHQPVAVIDAGGTNLRIGLAEFDADGKIQLSHFTKQPMPGRDHEISADEFYAVLADGLEPFKDQFDHIGFCFSYPATITPEYDGRLVRWTKEVKIPELVGKEIGAGLIQVLEARGILGRKVVVLNDTVAALLAGIAEGQSFDASSYIGFILGTGTNTAYVEQNEKIGKLPEGFRAGSQVINVESGGFSKFAQGTVDQLLDAGSEKPGAQQFEKTISGVYLGPITLMLLETLAKEGAFSESGAQALAEMEALSTIHIDNLAAENGRDIGVLASDCFSDEDREIMKTVFRAVVERAALFTAVNITAAVVKCGAGKDPSHPICVNIDGSTYYKTSGLAAQVQAHLNVLLAERGLHIRCIQVDDAPVVGAAIAGLTTRWE